MALPVCFPRYLPSFWPQNTDEKERLRKELSLSSLQNRQTSSTLHRTNYKTPQTLRPPHWAQKPGRTDTRPGFRGESQLWGSRGAEGSSPARKEVSHQQTRFTCPALPGPEAMLPPLGKQVPPGTTAAQAPCQVPHCAGPPCPQEASGVGGNAGIKETFESMDSCTYWSFKPGQLGNRSWPGEATWELGTRTGESQARGTRLRRRCSRTGTAGVAGCLIGICKTTRHKQGGDAAEMPHK